MTDFPSAFGSSVNSNNVSGLLQDDSFLLRSALTFDWGAVLDRCGLLMEVFSTSVRDRDEASHKRLKCLARKHLTTTDQWGNTALHAICYNRAPMDAVVAILDAGAATNLVLTRAQHNDGSTPLLVACAVGCAPEMIQALLLHDAASDWNAPISVARAPDSHGNTPLSELCHYYQRHRTDRRHRRNSPPLDEVNLLDTHDLSVFFHDFWSKVESIVRASWRDCGWESMPSILHGCCLVAESCPVALTNLICRCYPHMVSSTDRHGVLPLHLVVRPGPFSLRRKACMIDRLCERYPQAASKACPDSGRTPLCVAVSSGLTWSHDDQAGPLQRIWQCAPEAIHSRDTQTGLYPFLLAATAQQQQQQQQQQHDHLEEIRCVDNIYGLLRCYPQVLHSFATKAIL